ncbi:hypothetical protein ACWEWQ_36090, partial [Streptomyces sp. NPDC003832]
WTPGPWRSSAGSTAAPPSSSRPRTRRCAGHVGRGPARDAREENALREEVARAVAAANSTVSRSESIRVFRVLAEPFDQANGMLTPSMKLRRDAIVRHYALEIDAMYQARAKPARQGAPDESAVWDENDNVFR